MNDIRVLTFNIRLARAERGTPDAWPCRKEACLDIVREGAYDFVGIQEVVWEPTMPEFDQYADFRDGLPGYGILGRPRGDDPKAGESVALLYRRDRWEADAVESGAVWMSETPEKPSMSWETCCPRMLVWGVFHELRDGVRTGKSVMVANAHLDHILEHTQLLQAKMADEFLAKHRPAGTPVVLMGDFNAYERSWPVRFLCGEALRIGTGELAAVMPFGDAWRTVHSDEPDARTFHNWGRWCPDNRIDYLLYAGNLKVVDSTVDRRQYGPENRYPSDHYPVSATFRMA